MSEKTREELKEQIKIMNHNYQTIKEMHERGYQYSISEIKQLQDELERTRKALEIAVDALNKCHETFTKSEALIVANKHNRIANKALAEITALEQKDVK